VTVVKPELILNLRRYRFVPRS